LRVNIKEGVLIVRERGDMEIINTAIDEFLVSLAEDQKEKAISIIFSGGGTDGAIGSKLVHDNGGIVLVQDPSSAIVSSMPQATINIDSPQAILPPKKLGEILTKVIASKEVAE
jgi:two-component system CheB/CheR fusion protein